MGRTVKRAANHDPIVALGLLFVGLASLCLAVLYPVGRLFDSTTAAVLHADALVVFSADTVVVVVGCLLVSVVATTLGLVILLVRL